MGIYLMRRTETVWLFFHLLFVLTFLDRCGLFEGGIALDGRSLNDEVTPNSMYRR